MEFRRFLSTKNVIILFVTLTLLILTAGYFISRKPPRVPMEKYAPANALAYIEINSITNVIDGLTETKAWNEIAPVLGLSSQLKQLGSGIEFMSSTGLGPDEVIIAGRAQYAVVVTGVGAGAGANEEGVYLNVKPQFALIVETHSGAEKAAKLAAERASLIAKRIFGDSTQEGSSNYEGTRLMTFHPAQPERQLVAAASGSIVLIANHESAIKVCLDAIAKRTATLAENEILRQNREIVDDDSAIFAYVTKSGIEKLAQFGPTVFAARFTNNPDALTATANLFGHISNQTTDGMFYGLRFSKGEVVENYLLALRPTIATGLMAAIKPNVKSGFKVLQLVPASVEDCTILNIESVGVLPGNLLKHLSPNLDLVAGLALREFVINLYKQLGVETSDSLNNVIGNEIALVKMRPSEPVVMMIQVKDRSQILVAMNRYLAKDNEKISSETYNGTEVSVSSNEDGRAAAFVENYLVLGTSNQIKRIIDTKDSQASAATQPRVVKPFSLPPNDPAILSYEADEKKTGEMMLVISKLTRVTDGSRELLEKEPMQKAFSRLPYATSFTSFRDSGVFTQTISAVGIFKHISDLLE
jgi:hypothetical protein